MSVQCSAANQLFHQPGQLVGGVGEVEHHEEVHADAEVVVDGDDPEARPDEAGVEAVLAEHLPRLLVQVIGPRFLKYTALWYRTEM